MNAGTATSVASLVHGLEEGWPGAADYNLGNVFSDEDEVNPEELDPAIDIPYGVRHPEVGVAPSATREHLVLMRGSSTSSAAGACATTPRPTRRNATATPAPTTQPGRRRPPALARG